MSICFVIQLIADCILSMCLMYLFASKLLRAIIDSSKIHRQELKKLSSPQHHQSMIHTNKERWIGIIAKQMNLTIFGMATTSGWIIYNTLVFLIGTFAGSHDLGLMTEILHLMD